MVASVRLESTEPMVGEIAGLCAAACWAQTASEHETETIKVQPLVEHYRPEHYRRLAAKPGITGLWQVSGRSHTTFEEMIALDLEYIRSASLLTDLRLLIRTIPVVLAQHGAQ